MVLRYFLNKLVNNPYVIERLADSRPIRTAARFVAFLYQKSRAELGSSDLAKRANRFTDTFTKELESEIKKPRNSGKK